MEFIQEYNWSITIGLIALLFVMIFAGSYFIAKIGRRRNAIKANKEETEYKNKYAKIQKIIRDYQVCKQNMDWIEKLFVNLRSCEYKNPEMTEVLYNEFLEKYKHIKKQVSEV